MDRFLVDWSVFLEWTGDGWSVNEELWYNVGPPTNVIEGGFSRLEEAKSCKERIIQFHKDLGHRRMVVSGEFKYGQVS